jgi:uncharacterized membrane protein YfcA
MDYAGLALAVAALAAGGVLKGAIGAGSPILAVPILALLYDVPTAVAIFTFPNILSNAWQGWTYRAHQISPRFVWTFAGAGAIGAGIGSVLLAVLRGDLLLAIVAMVVFVYIGVRLAKPGWTLGRVQAARLAPVAGLIGGMMQGAGGISAPVSVTFLNAMRLERSEFIATISIFFIAMALVQIPALWSLGILTPHLIGLSFLAAIPLFGAMPVGAFLARHISREKFDRIILWLLAAIALRLLYGALA